MGCYRLNEVPMSSGYSLLIRSHFVSVCVCHNCKSTDSIDSRIRITQISNKLLLPALFVDNQKRS